jgi:two-component system, NtrC family, nitrogen regulation sensor histidine kinase NtrY
MPPNRRQPKAKNDQDKFVLQISSKYRFHGFWGFIMLYNEWALNEDAGSYVMNDSPGNIAPPKKNGSRTRRYTIGAILFLALSLVAIQTFLHITSVGSQRFIGMTFLLWTTTLVVVLAIMILATVLGRNLIKLYFERKSGQLGSGFKTKMVSTFIVLSFLPALLLFILAYLLISRAMEQWFLKPTDQIMEHSRVLAEQYYADAEHRAKFYAASIAESFASPEDLSPDLQEKRHPQLEEFREEYALGSVEVFDIRGRRIAEAGATVSSKALEGKKRSLISEAFLGHTGFKYDRITATDPINEIRWASAPIRDRKGAVIGAVLTETTNPRRAQFRADAVKEAYAKYEKLKGEENRLRSIALLWLVLSTLLIVFAFSWFGLYLAKRITVPIQALAQGAVEVAAGNLKYRVECQALDELGSLVASFNRMTGDLEENEKRIEAAQQSLRKTNIEQADRRRYIETILQTIATGVIALDSYYRVRTMNRAAMEMLHVLDFAGEAPLESVLQPSACETIRALLSKSAVLGTVVRNIELAFPGKTLHLAATVTPLVDTAGQRTGWVIVLDDMTELLRMEKMSAWQEVARRMAHEIKNPLTPIQLSAERILKRYKQIVPSLPETQTPRQVELSKFDKLLTECIQVIIQEADSLKSLVDEFSRFARLPEVHPEEADLNHILDNTLNLYDGRIQDVSVRKDYDSDVPKLRLDSEQMKRVFINLFDNALEAMSENPSRKILHLRTHYNRRQGSVSIEIGDSGRGFPEEYQDSVFLPYFSTRKGGTGLGLAIVRQIISDHHGNVRAEPNTPVGTKIIINLPL